MTTKKPKPNDDERVSIFVSPATRNRLKAKAAKQGKSMNKMLDDYSKEK